MSGLIGPLFIKHQTYYYQIIYLLRKVLSKVPDPEKVMVALR